MTLAEVNSITGEKSVIFKKVKKRGWGFGIELIGSREPMGPKQTLELIWNFNLSDLNLSFDFFCKGKEGFWLGHGELSSV